MSVPQTVGRVVGHVLRDYISRMHVGRFDGTVSEKLWNCWVIQQIKSAKGKMSWMIRDICIDKLLDQSV